MYTYRFIYIIIIYNKYTSKFKALAFQDGIERSKAFRWGLWDRLHMFNT